MGWVVLYLVVQLCLTLCDPRDYSLPGSSVHGDSPGKNTGVGCHALLQGIFPTQGSNPGLLHWRWILYHLSHQGSPRILEWVAYPFSRGSSQPRNWTGVSCIASGFFTSWATRKAQGWVLGQWKYMGQVWRYSHPSRAQEGRQRTRHRLQGKGKARDSKMLCSHRLFFSFFFFFSWKMAQPAHPTCGHQC